MIVLPTPNFLPAVEVRTLEIDIEYWQHWKLATFFRRPYGNSTSTVKNRNAELPPSGTSLHPSNNSAFPFTLNLGTNEFPAPSVEWLNSNIGLPPSIQKRVILKSSFAFVGAIQCSTHLPLHSFTLCSIAKELKNWMCSHAFAIW